MEGQMQDVLAGQARWAVECGDALEALSQLPDGCCDSIVTDPPAGIAFMGKEWDKPNNFPLRERGPLRGTPDHAAHAHERGFANGMHIDSGRRARDTFIAGLAAVFTECRRCIKPGGYALVWALPRTSHWTATALEDSGFRIIDIITHHFGQGFPKGKGQLKPASEHWILCRAPGPLQPLQIDAARVSVDGLRAAHTPTGRTGNVYGAGLEGSRRIAPQTQGRWPPNAIFSHVGGPDGCQPAGVQRVRGTNTPGPNGRSAQRQIGWTLSAGRINHYADADGYETVDAWTCHPQCPIRLLDEQAGPRTSGGRAHHAGEISQSNWRAHEGRSDTHRHGSPYARDASTGSASRFFPTFPGPAPADAVPFRYVPKAPPSERRLADGTPTGHPTQKPAALAQWLASLICQPGGTVLDPFAGVGSLGVGALRAGCHYLGIEQDAGYAAVAQRRLGEEQEQQSGPLFAGIAGQR